MCVRGGGEGEGREGGVGHRCMCVRGEGRGEGREGRVGHGVHV